MSDQLRSFVFDLAPRASAPAGRTGAILLYCERVDIRENGRRSPAPTAKRAGAPPVHVLAALPAPASNCIRVRFSSESERARRKNRSNTLVLRGRFRGRKPLSELKRTRMLRVRFTSESERK